MMRAPTLRHVSAADGTVQSIGVYQPLLGTDIEIRVTATTAWAARAIEHAAVAEIRRLNDVFSVFDPASALSRWRSGRSDEVPAELADVMAQAHRWWHLSAGAFHPAAAGLRQRWLQAQDTGRLPDRDEMATLAHGLTELPYDVEPADRADVAEPTGAAGRSERPRLVVHRRGDCSHVDLNAIAKGYIVDAAVARGMSRPGAVALTVNAGGDLRHTGRDGIRVGVEDPLRPSLNAPRVDAVQLSNAALATSGGVHRGFLVGGRRFSHVIDPRTGWPVDHSAAATVWAPTAVTADAVSTLAGVLTSEDAVAFADRHDLGLLYVAATSESDPSRLARSRAWPGETS